MKPKKSSPAVTGRYDCCQTPPEALKPLLPYLKKLTEGRHDAFGAGLNGPRIWEPASGEHYLTVALTMAGCNVRGSDIATEQDFFSWTPEEFHRVDAIVTNPPYSIADKWLARCYQLGLPFALLIPVERIGTERIQKQMREHGAELLLLNRRVNFKMPSHESFGEGGAQFPVLWLCHRILPVPLVYGDVPLVVRPKPSARK